MAKKKTNILMIIAIVIFIGALISVVTLTKKDYTSFATCLTDKGFIMAGTEWCPHCKTQKALFKGAFEEVIIPAGAYKDCDLQKTWCEENGVTGYPSWITPEGSIVAGTQKLDTLERMSGCSLSS